MKKGAFPMGKAPKERGLGGSDAAEHVIVRPHVVVPHEQLASVGFVVEVVGEAAHHPFEVVALIDDVPGEVLFAVPLSAVCFLEVIEGVRELHVVIDGLLTVLVAHVVVFDDVIEVVLGHEALVVPLAGEALVVLRHQLGVLLVGVDRAAEVDEVVVAVERREVYPQAAERAVVVLAVSPDVDGGFAVAFALVPRNGVLQFGHSVAQFFESFLDSWSDVEFSEL